MADVRVRWTNPTFFTDGTPLPPNEPRSYEIQHRVNSGSITTATSSSSGPLNEFTLRGYSPEDVVEARVNVIVGGQRSEPQPFASIVIPQPNLPGSPADITLEVI